MSWAHGSQRYPRGLIGPAGETAARTAIIDSAILQPATAHAGEVGEILGVKLNGPLDSAGYIVPLTKGIPGPVVTALFEVKSVRSWLYPTAGEPYQLLSKAVRVSRGRPSELVVPVLICRRAHYTTYQMAKRLGFLIIEMEKLFVGDVPEEDLIRVRNTLHFHDLVHGSGPSLRVRDRLRKVVHPECVDYASTWQSTAASPIGTSILEIKKAANAEERRKLVWELEASLGGWT